MKLEAARSFLFVPGDQSEKIEKAFKSGADAVIIDLEDAVQTENKVSARNSLGSLNPHQKIDGALFIVRVNAFDTVECLDDLKAAIAAGVDAVVIPKFVPGAKAQAIDDAIKAIEIDLEVSAPVAVIALVESAEGVIGLINGSEIPDRVCRLALGAADFLGDLSLSAKAPQIYIDLAMASLVLASAMKKIAPPIASPHFTLRDAEGLRESSLHARAMGFGGRLCIHPDQIAIVRASFEIDSAELTWAQRVIAIWPNEEMSKGGAIVIDGELIDEAMVKRARAVIELL